MTLNKVFSTQIDTAGVSPNGLNFQLSINQNFWNGLSKEHRLGVIKHELLHLCFFHIFMRDSFKNWKLFNIAADLEVNQLIHPGYLIPDALTIDMFPDLNLPAKAGTKRYYELLQNNLRSSNSSSILKEIYDNSDLHGDWDDILTDENGDKVDSSQRNLMKSQIETQLKDVVSNIKDRGLIPGELKVIIDEVLKIKEAVFNWKAYFRRLMGYSFNIFTKKTYRNPSLRFEDSAGLKIKKKHNILVAIDTSGSVSDDELMDFFSEIYHIYKTDCRIEIIECDTRITDQYIYTGKFRGKVTGRGGTDFQPVIDYYNENKGKYTVLIFFTDGGAPIDKLKPFKKMIWVITSSGVKAKYPGYTIYIPKQNK
jgi:predicted metal-dependent peptidase